jgi:hypothetical protein
MARGRHRYIPPRRLAIPLGIGGCAVLSAGAALLTADSPGAVPSLLVVVTAGAAVAGAILMRRRDLAAEQRVSRERAAKSAIAWQAEKQRGELEEAQERVTELEVKLTGKRADLNRLRSEHAELLRRYALAENGRATALEGRRQLALEAAQPTRALGAGPTDHRTAAGKPTRLTYLQADEALRNLTRNAARQRLAAQPWSTSAGSTQHRLRLHSRHSLLDWAGTPPCASSLRKARDAGASPARARLGPGS